MGVFPQNWKKANVVSIHKKSDKRSTKNYRPVSLPPVCGEIFERLLYNMFYFFIENDLMSQTQPGSKPGDSCINQLLSITHEIYKSFDDMWEVRGVFLDISKAFDITKSLASRCDIKTKAKWYLRKFTKDYSKLPFK